MKRIEDLGENECVSLPKRKKALKFLNFIGQSHLFLSWRAHNYYYFPSENKILWTPAVDGMVYSAVDFLPKKQSLKKEVKAFAKEINEVNKDQYLKISKLEADVRRLNDLYGNCTKYSFLKTDIESQAKAEDTFNKLKGNDIDWSVSGQLVEKDGDKILMTTGNNTKNTFEAVVISHTNYNQGYISLEWIKKLFTPSTKTLTVK